MKQHLWSLLFCWIGHFFFRKSAFLDLVFFWIKRFWYFLLPILLSLCESNGLVKARQQYLQKMPRNTFRLGLCSNSRFLIQPVQYFWVSHLVLWKIGWLVLVHTQPKYCFFPSKENEYYFLMWSSHSEPTSFMWHLLSPLFVFRPEMHIFIFQQLLLDGATCHIT